MGRYYVLRDGQAIEEPDYAKWAEWYSHSAADRCIACTKLAYGTVSTVFLAMNMTLSRVDPPLLFETRVKDGWLADEWQRYSTLAEATAGHEAWVARVREAENENRFPPPGLPVW